MEDTQFYDYTDRFGETHKVCFSRASYYDNRNLAVLAYCDEEGGLWPYADITVNIEPLDDPCLAAIDTNNLGDGIVEWLEDNGIASFAGRTIPSGFCLFPVVKFDEDWLDSLPYEGAE